MVILFSKNNSKETLLHVAATGGHVDIIKMLVNAQVNISARDHNWNTPLHLAAKHGKVKAVKYLMQVTDEQQERSIAEKEHRKRRTKDTGGEMEALDEREFNIFGRDYSYLDEAILSGQRYIIVVLCMDAV